jgi:tetratricopeptide (TPR) repeat protein
MTIKRHKIFLILLLHSTSKCNASIKDLGRGNDKKEACLRLAELFYTQRKFSAAEKTIKETLGGYNLRDKRECLPLSNIYYEQGRYDAALDVIEDYIKNNLKDPGAIFNLGKIYYMQGRNDPKTREGNFKQAIRKFEESLLYVDSDNLSLKGEIYCNLAQLYFDKGEKELAIKMIDEALKYRPDDSSFRQLRRVILEPFLSSEENEIFNKVLYYDLGNIINLCRLYNVGIILLNYPSQNQNSIRKEIADKYKVPFIYKYWF